MDYSKTGTYIVRETRDMIYVTVYDYRTDKPTLVQCRKTENGIEYEREKIK